MTLVNLRDRTIDAKVVYYGAGSSGKTTNLSYVHGVVDPHERLDLVSLNTEGDRTLFFDFVPIPLGRVGDYRLRLQAYTVPGQPRHNLTRRYVLRGADGVVFVADSRPGALDANLEALLGLRDNLIANGLDPQVTPLLIQYNKRDVAGATDLRELRAALNREGFPEVEAVATRGLGVWESFTHICSAALERVVATHDLGDPVAARREVEDLLAALGETRSPGGAPEPEPRGDGVYLVEPVTPIPSLQCVTVAAERVGRDEALGDVALAVATERDVAPLLARVADVCARTLVATDVSVLLFDAEREVLRVAHATDGAADRLTTEAAALPRRRERILRGLPFSIALDGADGSADGVAADRARAAVVAPLGHRGDVHGALVAYLRAPPSAARSDEAWLRCAAAHLAAYLENEALRHRLEAFEDEVRRTVSERTVELQRDARTAEEHSRSGAGFQAAVCEGALASVRSLAALADALAAPRDGEPRAVEAERDAFANVVRRETRRLERRLESLLDLSRVASGEGALRPAAQDLRRHLQAAYRRLHPLYKEKQLRIRVFADDTPPDAWVDERWLARALDALLANAAGFSPSGSEVHATLRLLDGAACVEIQDHGETLAPDGDAAERLRPSGEAALRLAVARAVVERLGGRSWYRPADAAGNVFAFTLPAPPA